MNLPTEIITEILTYAVKTENGYNATRAALKNCMFVSKRFRDIITHSPSIRGALLPLYGLLPSERSMQLFMRSQIFTVTNEACFSRWCDYIVIKAGTEYSLMRQGTVVMKSVLFIYLGHYAVCISPPDYEFKIYYKSHNNVVFQDKQFRIVEETSCGIRIMLSDEGSIDTVLLIKEADKKQISLCAPVLYLYDCCIMYESNVPRKIFYRDIFAGNSVHIICPPIPNYLLKKHECVYSDGNMFIISKKLHYIIYEYIAIEVETYRVLWRIIGKGYAHDRRQFFIVGDKILDIRTGHTVFELNGRKIQYVAYTQDFSQYAVKN